MSWMRRALARLDELDTVADPAGIRDVGAILAVRPRYEPDEFIAGWRARVDAVAGADAGVRERGEALRTMRASWPGWTMATLNTAVGVQEFIVAALATNLAEGEEPEE